MSTLKVNNIEPRTGDTVSIGGKLTGDTLSVSGYVDVGKSISSSDSVTFRGTSTGYQYQECHSDHLAFNKKKGAHGFFFRANDDGTAEGGNSVNLVELYDNVLMFYTNNLKRMNINHEGRVDIIGSLYVNGTPKIGSDDLITVLSTLRNATKDETTFEGLRDSLSTAIGGLIEEFEALQLEAAQEFEAMQSEATEEEPQ